MSRRLQGVHKVYSPGAAENTVAQCRKEPVKGTLEPTAIETNIKGRISAEVRHVSR
jgi:hypothetical protein